jgi:endonuclease-3
MTPSRTRARGSTGAGSRRSAARRYTPAELIALLGAEYGRLPERPHHDAMAELVLTLLSQNTSDHNSGRAFQRLLARFPGWDEVLAAPTAEVEEAIRPGGLAPTKAPRLQAMIGAARKRAAVRADGGASGDATDGANDGERDPYDLRFLDDLPLDEAKAWLRALPGVGPKTAACVLLFGLGRPALPVDTHVERLARRLALVPPRMPVERVHDELEAMLAPTEVYAFHIDLIQHGRRTCHARRPACERCVLLARCPRVGVEGAAPATRAAEAGAAP